MIQHAKTRFPCMLDPSDFVRLEWDQDDFITIAVVTEKANFVGITRDQAKSLRDQLTEWLKEE